jgi:hypothetical protein
LRNLSISGGGTGIHGIRFLTGGALHIENCVIFNFLQKGISFEPAAASRMFIKDSIIRNNNDPTNGGGVFIHPGAAGATSVILDNVRLEGNHFGLTATDRSIVSIRNSPVAASGTVGVAANSTGAIAVVNLESCMITENNGAAGSTGLSATGAKGVIRISNVIVVNNSIGLSTAGGGVIGSFGNNRVSGNVTDGAPSGTAPQV